MSHETRTDEPHDRLTRICDAMSDTFRNHPEHLPDDKGVIFLDDDKLGGLVIMDYGHDSEAVAAVLYHVRAILRANGKDLKIIALGRG